jgi:hypothetical protein
MSTVYRDDNPFGLSVIESLGCIETVSSSRETTLVVTDWSPRAKCLAR